ncbi:MAG TPA: PEP-CTERM sorting domain-containing protein [Bradyrhizobium sp.]|nr:PEP-CTERM sorting domain-containing protein [Bradyrhizobium sp.]
MKGLALTPRRGFRKLLALAALSAPLALPAHATNFTLGEFVSHSQVLWGDAPACNMFGCNPSAILENNFNSVFAPSDLMEVGVPGALGFSLIFDSADAVIAYLPAGGMPGPLTADLDDPITSASGALGGEVVTATLNLLFSDDSLLAHPLGVPFGDLVLQNLNLLPSDSVFGFGVGPEIAQLDGMSVSEVLDDADLLLGGIPSPFTAQDLFTLLNDIDMSFNGAVLLSSGAEIDGLPDTFATEYLALPEGITVPEPSTWAMMLIGFAGLGYARYLASRRITASIKRPTPREV